MRNSLPIRLRRLLRPLGLAGLLAAGCGVALAQPQPSSPDPLVTDLSAHLIAITSNFTGTELLLFGSTEEPGDIVVVVRGPPHAMRVRLKSRFAGIWINRRSQQFDTVPAYYATTSSRPLQQIASPGLLTRLQIGADNLRFSPRRDIGEAELQPYREAIIRNKEREQLYQEDAVPVTFLGPRLFRTAVNFPATVPVGTYRAEVYLIRNDRVIAAQATPLFIDKYGSEQQVFELAHSMPLLYGLTAVAAAMLAGWLASVVFRKR